MTEVNKQKAKKAAQIAKRVGLVLAATAAATTFVACPPEQKEEPTPDPKCECPAGTEHLSGDLDGTECCDICADDHCTIVDGKTMANGIKVYITDGVTGVTADQAIAKINAAFAVIVEWEGPNEAAFAEGNINIVRIVPGVSATVNFVKENGKWIAVIDDAAITSPMSVDIIGGKFWDFAEENMVPIGLFKQFDNSKNNVRMALNGALRSSVDELMQHSVAQNKSKQDEKRANALA